MTTPLVQARADDAAWRCARCGVDVAPALLACPGCRALRHAERLKELAGEAEACAAHDPAASRDRWREALGLLPPDAGQHAAVSARLEAAERAAAAAGTTAKAKPETAKGDATKRTGIGAAVAAALALLSKFKLAIVFALTKGKLLLLGLSKMSTVLSMLVSFGVYWTMWGWRFAGGFVLSIYVHEMGHVAALRRRGVAASAPMFVPGIGAFVRLRQAPRSEWEDADVGLAGPLWGLGAALAAYGGWLATGAPVWAAIAKTGALINLFNLAPVWQLDGARGFRAMTRAHRIAAVAAVVAAFALVHEPMLLIVAGLGAYQAFQPPAREPDARAVGLYVGLVAAFAALLSFTITVRA